MKKQLFLALVLLSTAVGIMFYYHVQNREYPDRRNPRIRMKNGRVINCIRPGKFGFENTPEKCQNYCKDHPEGPIGTVENAPENPNTDSLCCCNPE